MYFHLLCFTVNYSHNSLCNSNCPRLASGSSLILAPVSFWHPLIPQLVFECYLAVYHKMCQVHLVNSLSYTRISHLLCQYPWLWHLIPAPLVPRIRIWPPAYCPSRPRVHPGSPDCGQGFGCGLLGAPGGFSGYYKVRIPPALESPEPSTICACHPGPGGSTRGKVQSLCLQLGLDPLQSLSPPPL